MDWVAIFVLFLNVVGFVHWCVVQYCSGGTIRTLESVWVMIVLVGAVSGYRWIVWMGGAGIVTLLIMQAVVPDDPEFEIELILE